MPYINLNLRPGGKRAIICLLIAVPILFCSAAPTPTTIEAGSVGKWNRYKDTITRICGRLEKQLTRLQSKNPNWQQDKRAREWAFRVQSMKNTLENLRNLETSSQLYAIRDTTLQYGNTQYRLKGSVIELLVGDAANFVHETTHGGHFETRDLMYINNSQKEYAPPFGNDQWDEVAAYRAEYAFKPDAVKKLPSPKRINTVDDIDNEWLLGLKQDDKTVYHPEDPAHVVAVRINIDSPGDSVVKAYYFLPGIGSWKDNYRSIRENKLIIYKH